MNEDRHEHALKRLKNAVDDQGKLVSQWKSQSEALLFETVRSIDNIFCQELFYFYDDEQSISLEEITLMGWGTNNALRQMIPDTFLDGDLTYFRSSNELGGTANNLLFHGGALERGLKLHSWMKHGLLSGYLDEIGHETTSGIGSVLVLKSAHPELFSEMISLESQKWKSNLQYEMDGPNEAELGRRHMEILPDLVKRVDKFSDWGITYTTSDEIDDYFLEWAKIYLRRMWGNDILDAGDVIGGEEYRSFLGVLVGVTGRAQKHLCYASILKRRYPLLNIKNLLTMFAPVDQFQVGLAKQMGADLIQIQKLLSAITLDPSNRDYHTDDGDIAWAPLIRGSDQNYILPLYGVEINPFLFLLKELRRQYRPQWDRLVNGREARWITEIGHLFPGEQWKARSQSLNLKSKSGIFTDIDFLAYDADNNELALYQLKWQDPVGGNERGRRSAGKNLMVSANKWVDVVCSWIEENGINELAKRAGFKTKPDLKFRLFILTRYNIFFSGFNERDNRAVWLDWNNLIKNRMENPIASVREMAATIEGQSEAFLSTMKQESYMFPLGNLAVILNPESEPNTG